MRGKLDGGRQHMRQARLVIREVIDIEEQRATREFQRQGHRRVNVDWNQSEIDALSRDDCNAVGTARDQAGRLP